MAESLVSVLISVYNAGEFLRPSVESILSQTYKNLEIIIIDDGSTDGCMDTIFDIKDERIKILRQENKGKSAALNRALEIMSGEFYAIQDADDMSYPTRIEKQVKAMQKDRELAAAFTGYNLIINGKKLAPRLRSKDKEECCKDIEEMRMPSQDPTVMFKCSSVKGLRYEENLQIGQGWDYVLRVGELYPMEVLGECLYSYRINITSNTRMNSFRRSNMVQKVLERACHRRGLVYQPNGKKKMSENDFSKGYEHGVVPHFMESVLDLKRASKSIEALRTAITSISLNPLNPYYYKPLIYWLVPLFLIEYYRRTKQ